jgi:hypothetical protein
LPLFPKYLQPLPCSLGKFSGDRAWPPAKRPRLTAERGMLIEIRVSTENKSE